ncbi:nitroreductase [Bordetella sp. BOR01]|uniref:nitroreductase n=1 Tax=Bordetella sp. BOR01 TaxID=2854779 RepID=UPI001C43D08A|nr:nitroreductase [Bordetella sp. BOR01]MBV7483206.1 nitroreductase [Bordetella sp. BOR01]
MQDSASLRCEMVDEVITSRRSVRAFRSTPVARTDIEAVLRVAGRAPSGSNIQPWRVYVLAGAARDGLSRALLDVYNDPVRRDSETEEYAYYPTQWISPFVERRRKVGWDLYGLLGLTREDKAGMHEQLGRNFSFFGAPVALMFTMDRTMELGSWLDYGMFLQNIMIAARGRGIDTCPQAAFARYHRVIRAYLGMPDRERFVCGMSMGYADTGDVVNSLVVDRAPLDHYTVFMNDEPARAKHP